MKDHKVFKSTDGGKTFKPWTSMRAEENAVETARAAQKKYPQYQFMVMREHRHWVNVSF